MQIHTLYQRDNAKVRALRLAIQLEPSDLAILDKLSFSAEADNPASTLL